MVNKYVKIFPCKNQLGVKKDYSTIRKSVTMIFRKQLGGEEIHTAMLCCRIVYRMLTLIE